MPKDPSGSGLLDQSQTPCEGCPWWIIVTCLIAWPSAGDISYKFLPYQFLTVRYWPTVALTGNGELGFDSGEGAWETKAVKTQKSNSHRAKQVSGVRKNWGVFAKKIFQEKALESLLFSRKQFIKSGLRLKTTVYTNEHLAGLLKSGFKETQLEVLQKSMN